MRIKFSNQTVKALEARLQKAFKWQNVRLVRRLSALLEHGQQGRPVAQVVGKWGISPATLYQWLSEFMVEGLKSLYYQHGGGRPCRLNLAQKKQLHEYLDAGPQAVGFETACWSSLIVAELIENKFGVKYHRHYVIALLRSWGYSFQKAEHTSDHLDEAKRQEWLLTT